MADINEKMREEFEAWAVAEGFALKPSWNGTYKTPSTRWAWQSWQASREALVIQVPELQLCCEDFGVEFIKNIEAHGVKVKP